MICDPLEFELLHQRIETLFTDTIDAIAPDHAAAGIEGHAFNFAIRRDRFRQIITANVIMMCFPHPISNKARKFHERFGS